MDAEQKPTLYKFKCPNCGHEWEAEIAPGLAPADQQYCKVCKRYNNCRRQETYIEKMRRLSGKK